MLAERRDRDLAPVQPLGQRRGGRHLEQGGVIDVQVTRQGRLDHMIDGFTGGRAAVLHRPPEGPRHAAAELELGLAFRHHESPPERADRLVIPDDEPAGSPMISGSGPAGRIFLPGAIDRSIA